MNNMEELLQEIKKVKQIAKWTLITLITCFFILGLHFIEHHYHWF